jgi:uncharacterized protein (TIGR00645 family)
VRLAAPLRRLPLALSRLLFASRWLGAPLYVALIGGLLLLLLRFAMESWHLLATCLTLSNDEFIIALLSLVDLTLVANLMVMVIFAGYENFVARLDLDAAAKRPEWMGHIGIGELKVKLMTSIVAIAAIHVLENFMNPADHSDRVLGWSVGLFGALVATALILTLMDRVSEKV